MTGYPGNTKVAATGASPELSQVQFQIAALTEPIQELMKPKVGREQIWCTTCKTEDHHAHECPLNRRGVGVAQNPSGGPFPGRPGGGVVLVSAAAPFQHAAPFRNTAPYSNTHSTEYCEICCTYEHPPQHCLILQKYSSISNIVYCEFCHSSAHSQDICRDLDALAEWMERSSFQVANNQQPQGARSRGGEGY